MICIKWVWCINWVSTWWIKWRRMLCVWFIQTYWAYLGSLWRYDNSILMMHGGGFWHNPTKPLYIPTIGWCLTYPFHKGWEGPMNLKYVGSWPQWGYPRRNPLQELRSVECKGHCGSAVGHIHNSMKKCTKFVLDAKTHRILDPFLLLFWYPLNWVIWFQVILNPKKRCIRALSLLVIRVP